MIPEGWQERKVRDLPGANGRPTTKLGPFGSSLKKSDYTPSGFKVYGQQQVLAGDQDFGEYWIDEAKFRQLEACAVQPGDILLSTMGSFGSALRLTEDCSEGIINPRLLRLSIDPEIAAPEFLEAYLKSSFAARQFLRFAQGGTMPAVNGASIGGLNLPLPPLPEQKKIAEILSTWDRAIETAEALLATARTQKRALMQTLLTGQRRFPEFEGQEWREVRLVDVMQGKKVKGKIVPTNDESLGVPYIGATSFEGNFSTYTDSDTAVLCDPSDLLVLWDGENAGAVAVGLRGAVSSTVVRFRFKPEIVSASFACAVMEMRNYQIRAVREGSGIPHMPKDFDQWFEFSLPTLAEQKMIMSVLDAARAEIRMLVLKIEKLRTEKKALMQQLLTGKRRVQV